MNQQSINPKQQEADSPARAGLSVSPNCEKAFSKRRMTPTQRAKKALAVRRLVSRLAAAAPSAAENRL